MGKLSNKDSVARGHPNDANCSCHSRLEKLTSAVRETGVSRYNGALLRAPLKPPVTKVLWWSTCFRAAFKLNFPWCLWTPFSRTAVRVIRFFFFPFSCHWHTFARKSNQRSRTAVCGTSFTFLSNQIYTLWFVHHFPSI